MGFSVYTFLKDSLKKALQSCGMDLIRYNIHTSNEILLRQIIRNFKINVVLDVGANKGLYSEELIKNGYRGKIFSFEPIPSVFELLNNRSLQQSHWQAFNLGIGSKEGTTEMNISENLVSSSILTVSEASLKAEPETRVTHREQIKITTIDLFTSQNNLINERILIKLDIQGYELEALKGALETLPHAVLIQVELSFVSVYKGAPLFWDVVTFLEKFDFDIFTIIPGFRNPHTGRMLQADGIFVNKKFAID